jgi:hypothetical protein
MKEEKAIGPTPNLLGEEFSVGSETRTRRYFQPELIDKRDFYSFDIKAEQIDRLPIKKIPRGNFYVNLLYIILKRFAHPWTESTHVCLHYCTCKIAQCLIAYSSG